MRDTTGSAEPYIQVDLHSLAEAGRFVVRLGDSLGGATRMVQRHGQAGLTSIPASDLFEAYAFCWGRWSAVFDDAARAVSDVGSALAGGARTFGHNDREAARGIRPTAQ